MSKSSRAGSPDRLLEVAGWVRTRRDSKQGFSFVELNDGSCLSNLQIVDRRRRARYDGRDIKQVTTGASLRIAGELKESPGKGQRGRAGRASRSRIVGTADAEAYPLQKKRHSFEFLREIAHLRPRTNTFGAIARVRNEVCASIHHFFQSRGFLYIQTPIITTSDCEGAGAMFQVTTLDLAKLPTTPAAAGPGPARSTIRPRLLWQAGLAHSQRAARGGDFRHVAGLTATRLGRRSGRRTRTRPGTWPSSG